MYKLLKKISYLCQGILLFFLFLFLRFLPLKLSSKLFGTFAKFVGPKINISKKAFKNIENAMPEKSQNEKIEIVKGMWENLGRVIGEYPHLKELIIKRKYSRIFIKGKKT